MDALELLELIQKGESSEVQFKVRIKKKDYSKSAYDVGTEMVAFSNTKGGILIVGVDDETGDISGMTYKEIQETNELLSNAATNNVNPQIFIKTETIKIDNDNVLVVHIPEGISKPHTDNKGIIWLKNGSDKRTVISREEIARLLQGSGNMYADETIVANTTINDIDKKVFDTFIEKKHDGKSLEQMNIAFPQYLSNMGVLKENQLSLAGLLLFGDNPQKNKPTFTVSCVAFKGTDATTSSYYSKKEPLEGNLKVLYDKSLSFIVQNLKNIQKDKNFNSVGELEIPVTAIEELLVNAFIHRDYFIQSSIKVFIFDDRVEIISPGRLPNTQSVESIKLGNSIVRNPILFSNARYLIPYEGVGTGIRRALKEHPSIEFINDKERELFISILKRE